MWKKYAENDDRTREREQKIQTQSSKSEGFWSMILSGVQNACVTYNDSWHAKYDVCGWGGHLLVWHPKQRGWCGLWWSEGDRATSTWWCAVSEGYVLCWLHQQNCHVADEGKRALKESSQSIRRKRRMSSVIERERTRLLDGHRDRHARRLWVSRPGDGRWRFRQKRQNGNRI